jgi:hypothetical protein
MSAFPIDPKAERLDFEGAYGQQYRRNIRTLIAGYDTHLELAADAVAASVPEQGQVLVVGPGWGDELELLFAQRPDLRLTLVEDSPAMLENCRQRLREWGREAQVCLIGSSLEAADLEPQQFQGVVALNVLHLFQTAAQQQFFEHLISFLGLQGVLVLSAYTEQVHPPASPELLRSLSLHRLRRCGLPEEQIAAIIASSGKSVFPLNGTQFSQWCLQAGLMEPVEVWRGLANCLWVTHRLCVQC